MAELASGAVSALLGVIRNESLLLDGVRGDVQFIQEEMESMNSFLAHLARWEPPGGEHNEQVRTWMNQVRLLAQDCNNCIDLYLYRGNPDIHRARGGLRRYLWWVSWFLHKLVAQHRAAEQLRQLKDRAREVGERRLRYGVQVPAMLMAAGQLPPPTAKSSSTLAAAQGGGYVVGDDEEDSGDYLGVVASNHYGPHVFIESRTLDDYVQVKLLEWAQEIPVNSNEAMSSLVIVARDTSYRDILALAHKTLVLPPDYGPYDLGYHRVVQVQVPEVHYDSLPLRPKEVLYYILRELKQGTGKGVEEDLDSWQVYCRKRVIYEEKKKALLNIKENIKEMKVHEKLEKIKSDIIRPRVQRGEQLQNLLQLDPEHKKGVDQLDLDVLLQLLFQSSSASQQDEVKNRDLHKLPAWDDNVIAKIAKKLKEHMEVDEKAKNLKQEETARHTEEEGEDEAIKHLGEQEEEEEPIKHMDDEEAVAASKHTEEEIPRQQMAPIGLREVRYAHILRQVFPKSSCRRPLQDQPQDRSAAKQDNTTKTTKTALCEEQIKQMIHDAKQEILQEVQEGKYQKSQETAEPEAASEEIEQKMDRIKEEFKEELKIKGLVDEIKRHLKGSCPLIILRVDEITSLSRWEDTRYALSLLECRAGVLIITNTEDTRLAKEWCYPQREPINYTLSGLYHDTVLELTCQQKNEDNYNTQIFRNILEACEPHEFCMKIFTHALYANPKRSNEELFKLHNNLQALPKSFNTIAKKMFMFSYNDLPKEYKSCLLYLAIFPQGHKIKRSTLIARWVTEGLTIKEDWLSSVSQANRCFDALIYRYLVYPDDIGPTGKVQSCVVHKLVHGFITTIARKQHIVETRLSHHLARHFSIFNDLQLRSSDGIGKFFQRLSESSQVSLLKVLDLEGSRCTGGTIQRYLKDICSKMLLLKYLSLRGIDITQLPSEINNLHELEVLDIRQTKVPAYAIVNVLLLKLKRLLAGRDTIGSVLIPHKIGKMVNIEVLSNVKAHNKDKLKDIGKLWQLRKLGMVVDDNKSHLKMLLQTISDLHECLRSLSITFPIARYEDTPSNYVELPADISSHLQDNPKRLESLSIRGTTLKGHLLPLFTKDVNNNLVKVTLSSTLLNQDDLNILAKLPKLQCVRLRRITSPESNLTFKKDEFKYLKYLLVEGSNFTNITFENEAACELEKMVLSFTNIEYIYGAYTLTKLEDLELNNNSCSKLLSSIDDATKITKLTLRGTLMKQSDLDTIAKKQNLCCLQLLDKSCDASQNQITFKKDGFTKLNLLIVDCSSITEIIFASESAPKLEKIIWSSFTLLSDIENLPRLKELEYNGDHVPNEVKEAIEKHKNKPNIKHSEPEIQDQAKGDEQEDERSARFSFFWNRQV